MNAVGPAFRTHGVVAMPHVIGYTTEIVPTKNGGTMNHVILHTRYTFTGPAGDTLDCEVYGEAMDSGDKAMSKAHSVAYRTALLQVLTIPTDEPDPDATTYERAETGGKTHGAAKPANLASEAQVGKIFGLAKEIGWTDEFLASSLKKSLGKDHPGDLTGGRDGEASKMIDYLTGKRDALKAEKATEESLGAEKIAETPVGIDEEIPF